MIPISNNGLEIASVHKFWYFLLVTYSFLLNSLEDPVNSLESPTADELAKIEAIEIEFVQFVLPWLKLVPPDSCCQDKVC